MRAYWSLVDAYAKVVT